MQHVLHDVVAACDTQLVWCRGVDEPMDASEEPEPIMVDESEHDDLVAAILDANVGLREADTRRYSLVYAISLYWYMTPEAQHPLLCSFALVPDTRRSALPCSTALHW